MIQDINKEENKKRIAIVVVGYNRQKSLSRLLESLNNAYYDSDHIPLVISIDASGNQDLYDYVKSYNWRHGTKYINIQEERLGLKDHIYQCGDLTRYFKAVALFEDDLWVSPYYYNYLVQVVERYGNEEEICEIALYKNERLGGNGFYFDTYHDGSDSFLWQDVCTWGECWTEQMWFGFRKWLENHDEEYVNGVDIPEGFKRWTRAWSKYYNAYEIDTCKYVLFPHESLTTNFNDAGGEHGGGSNVVQVNVLEGRRDYKFNDVERLIRYDIYCNNELLYEWIPEPYKGNVCLDLYGGRANYQGKRYVLSLKQLPYAVVAKWGLEMRPVELNIKYGIEGEGISIFDTSIIKRNVKEGYNKNVVPYMLRGFHPKLLLKYIIKHYKEIIARKFFK